MDQPKPNKTPDWLKRTQEGSWEPEVLISGIVLLALTQVPRLLRQLHYWLEERTAKFYFYTSSIDDFIFETLILSTNWLIAGLIVHLIMRSLWVSFIGLSFAFPKGADLSKMRFQPWFENRLRPISTFENSIIKLENLCSTLYATAFLFVMATVSFCLFLIFIFALGLVLAEFFPQVLQEENKLDLVLGIFSFSIAFPYFIDFVSLGMLKKLPWFWKIYRYPYRFMSSITLAPVYRGLYYGLIGNVSRKRVALIMVVFLIITYFRVVPGAVLPFQTPTIYNTTFGTANFDGYYRDQQPERFSTWAHIQSQQISEGALHVFLPHKLQFEEQMLADCSDNLKAAAVVDSFASKEARNLACLSAVYVFYIDGIKQAPGRFFMRELGHTGQLGLETWLDVAALPRGQHLLEVKVRIKNEERLRAAIPFFQLKD
jgi:hypothetical protein